MTPAMPEFIKAVEDLSQAACAVETWAFNVRQNGEFTGDELADLQSILPLLLIASESLRELTAARRHCPTCGFATFGATCVNCQLTEAKAGFQKVIAMGERRTV